MTAPDHASRIDYAVLKSDGTIMQRDDDFFAIRLQGSCIQASEALKFIPGIGEPLEGRLLCCNALDMTFYDAACEIREDCAICGEPPEITRIEDLAEELPGRQSGRVQT